MAITQEGRQLIELIMARKIDLNNRTYQHSIKPFLVILPDQLSQYILTPVIKLTASHPLNQPIKFRLISNIRNNLIQVQLIIVSTNSILIRRVGNVVLVEFYVVVDGFLLAGDFDDWGNVEDFYLGDEEFVKWREVRVGEVGV
jgi:hypothetical protein